MSTIELATLLGWWASGMAIVAYEMSFEEDVTVWQLLPILLLGTAGPIWILRTIYRKYGDVVLIKHQKEDNG